MAATGAQFMMFSTGRGAPQGFPSMPVIKICGNPNTYERMSHDMDINAGRIITGEKSIEEVGEEAYAKMLRVLSGEMTKNEAIGYFSAIDIHCLGPVIYAKYFLPLLFVPACIRKLTPLEFRKE